MVERNDPCWCGSGKKFKKCHLTADSEVAVKQDPPKVQNKLKAGVIKTPEQIEGMRRAGAFNGVLMDYIRPFIKMGVSTGEVNTRVHEYTIAHGHVPACLGYHGFPKSLCTSRNNIVCHGIPNSREFLEDGDIVNIDLTTIVDGYHGDSSETFLIGNVKDDARHLVNVTAQSLILGIRAVKPGVPLKAIGEAIQPFVESQGCSVVRQYTGHGIGQKFHEHFTVYHHIDRDCEPIHFEPGMTLTIEPMVNLGRFEVITDRKDGWTVRTKDESLSAQFEHTILVTESGCDILTLTPSQRAQGIILNVEGKSYG